MKRIEETIENIRSQIYDYQIQEALKQTVDLLEKVYKEMPKMDDEDEKILNEIVQYINAYIENRDYQTLADILKYELEPVLIKYYK